MLYKKGETAHSEHLHRAPRATRHGVSGEGKHSALDEQLVKGVVKTVHRVQEIQHTELKWS